MRGEPEKLALLHASDDFVALNARAQLVVDNFGIAGGFTGQELQSLFADFGKQAATMS